MFAPRRNGSHLSQAMRLKTQAVWRNPGLRFLALTGSWSWQTMSMGRLICVMQTMAKLYAHS